METFIGLAGLILSAFIALFTGLQLKRTTDSTFNVVATLMNAHNTNDLDCITVSFVDAKNSFAIQHIAIRGFKILDERTGVFKDSLDTTFPMQVRDIIQNGSQTKVVSKVPSIDLWGKVTEGSELIEIRMSLYSWPFSLFCFWASFTALLSVNNK